MPLTSLTEDEIVLKETGEGDDGRFAHIFFIFNSFLAFMSELWENDDELPNCVLRAEKKYEEKLRRLISSRAFLSWDDDNNLFNFEARL